MSLKELSNNLQTEDEFHTFTKKERVIRRQLSLHHLHKELINVIRSQEDTQQRKTNVKAFMTDWYLHQMNSYVNEVCNSAIDIVKSLQVKDQKGTLDKFFTYDCWGAVYSENDYTLPHTHGPALWSWVYYIEVPYNAPPLYFPQAKLKVFPKTDELIMFPGQVIHEVPKAIDMIGERIVLAGNIYLDYRNT